VTRNDVEHPNGLDVDIDPYLPACKSLGQQSYPAPPLRAYLDPGRKKGLRNYVRAEHNSVEGGKYGLGEFGTTVYQETFGRDDALPAKTLITKSSVPLGDAPRGYATAYADAYIPPPVLYTGVGPNVELHLLATRRARHDAHPGPGLGEDGRSSYQAFHVRHGGDVYRARPDARSGARVHHLAGAGARIKAAGPCRAEWTTANAAVGSSLDSLARIGGRPPPAGAAHRAAAAAEAAGGPGYGLGGAGSVYRAAFHRPTRSAQGRAAARAGREVVEGGPPLGMERYGPLGRSLAALSWRAPPREAYLERRAGTERPALVVPTGTLPPARAYGLGEFGSSSYRVDYTDPAAAPL
jgi:hypothetical protein